MTSRTMVAVILRHHAFEATIKQRTAPLCVCRRNWSSVVQEIIPDQSMLVIYRIVKRESPEVSPVPIKAIACQSRGRTAHIEERTADIQPKICRQSFGFCDVDHCGRPS